MPNCQVICTLCLALLFEFSTSSLLAKDVDTTRPNIVYMLADDLGIDDVLAMNPDGKIATLNIDRVAAERMRFTDAHSGSSVCTPTRYGLLTGRYAWRTRLQRGGWGYSPPLIAEGCMTRRCLRNRDTTSLCWQMASRLEVGTTKLAAGARR